MVTIADRDEPYLRRAAEDSSFGSLHQLSLLDQALAMPYAQSLSICVSFWAVLLMLIWLLPGDRDLKRQGADRALSTVHALCTSILGVVVELCSSPACTTRGTWLGAPMLLFLGYLVVDMGSILICDVWKRWRSPDYGMMFHHVFIFSFFSIGYVTDAGVWFASTLLINELSTPFVNAFWYLQYTGQKESRAFMINGLLLLFTFTFCRMVFIPYNFYQLVSIGLCLDSSNPTYSWGAYLMCFGYMLIYLLNGVWYGKLLRGACKKLMGGGSSADHDPSRDPEGSNGTSDGASEGADYKPIKG